MDGCFICYLTMLSRWRQLYRVELYEKLIVFSELKEDWGSNGRRIFKGNIPTFTLVD